MSVKRILCYGDSNTWGCSPSDGSRFGENVRWPMVMASLLGEGFVVIEDAKCGRTVLDLNSDPELNGISWIQSIIGNCLPLCAAIICLGINDVFDSGEIPLGQITDGLERIGCIIRESHVKNGFDVPCIIFLTPVMPVQQPEEMNFYQLQMNKAAALIAEYPVLARRTRSLSIDISGTIRVSEKDGSHLDSRSHIKLGGIISEFIKAEVL